MMIDGLGKVGPGYGPKKSESTQRKDQIPAGKDQVTISQEAAKAAEAAKISKLSGADEPGRAAQLQDIKAKISRGEYDKLTDEVISKIADTIADSFVGKA